MKTDSYDAKQRGWVWLTYVLHILLVPAAVAAVINALKIREYAQPAARDNVQHRDLTGVLATHHQWLLRTFLISLFFLAMGYGTIYYGVGYLLGIGAVIWWLYRMVRGVVMYAENKPMPVA